MKGSERHEWSDKFRAERHSDRGCWKCGLVKRTRHEDGRDWTEFVRDGVVQWDAGGRTPPCTGANKTERMYLQEGQ